MKSQMLDMKIEFIDGGVRLTFEGIFFIDNWASLKEKLEAFSSDGIKLFFCHVENVEFRDPELLQEFLDLHNDFSGRNARLIFIFNRKSVAKYFLPYRHILEIYPSYENFRKQGFVRALRKVGVAYSKKTGVRISPTTATLVLLLLAGWVLTLLSMIQSQTNELDQSEGLVQALTLEKESLSQEVKELERKIAPLRQLGLLQDSLDQVEYKKTPNWVDHLRKKNP